MAGARPAQPRAAGASSDDVEVVVVEMGAGVERGELDLVPLVAVLGVVEDALVLVVEDSGLRLGRVVVFLELLGLQERVGVPGALENRLAELDQVAAAARLKIADVVDIV